MKNILGMIGVSVLIISVGCRKGPSSSQTPDDGSSSGIPVISGQLVKKTLDPLDYEAAKQAVKLWEPAKLGDSYYVCRIGPTPGFFGASSDIKKTIIELRQPEIRVEPRSLSEADKLNGLDWKGSVGVYAKAVRSYGGLPNTTRPEKCWSEWRQSGGDGFIYFPGGREFGVDFEKKNGKWTIVGSVLEGTTFKQVDQSDLPQ